MTNLIEMLAIPAIAIGAYIFASKHITKFMMNGGKTEKQIINTHINDKNKRYMVKYPEANIQTSKNLLLAFGFIFAFASSIYAFSFLSETKIHEPFPVTVFDDTFEIMPPMSEIEERVERQKELIKKVEVIAEIVTVDEIPPDVIEEKVPEVKTKTETILNTDVIDIDDSGDKEVIDPPFFTVVEEMPKFRGCVGLDENEASECTNLQIQRFASQLEIPEIVIDNDLGGTVYVKFLVGKKGKIKKVEIERGANRLLDRAVLNHFKNLPDFASAGKQRGKEVDVQYIIPINIVLQ